GSRMLSSGRLSSRCSSMRRRTASWVPSTSGVFRCASSGPSMRVSSSRAFRWRPMTWPWISGDPMCRRARGTRVSSRKASGSYFTKHFAVEHLLDHALEPAIDDHLVRVEAFLSADEEARAANAFFDFRCVDLAMGSGHFLVAAVDRIESRLSAFLALHPVPNVTVELDRLRTAALEALGPLGEGVEIE